MGLDAQFPVHPDRLLTFEAAARPSTTSLFGITMQAPLQRLRSCFGRSSLRLRRHMFHAISCRSTCWDEALNSKWPRNVHKHNEHETELHTKYFQTLRIPEVSDMCHLGLNRCFALTCISCCSPAALSSQAIAKVSAKLTLQEKHLEEYLYKDFQKTLSRR